MKALILTLTTLFFASQAFACDVDCPGNIELSQYISANSWIQDGVDDTEIIGLLMASPKISLIQEAGVRAFFDNHLPTMYLDKSEAIATIIDASHMNDAHLEIAKALAKKGVYSPVGNSVLTLALQYIVTEEVLVAVLEQIQTARRQNGIDEEDVISSFLKSCERIQDL